MKKEIIDLKNLYDSCKSSEEKDALEKMFSMMLCLRKHDVIRNIYLKKDK